MPSYLRQAAVIGQYSCGAWNDHPEMRPPTTWPRRHRRLHLRRTQPPHRARHDYLHINGDGTLVSQATGGVTTRYTQDLAAPLSQVLQTQVGAATRTDYLYGLSRLALLNNGVKTTMARHDIRGIWYHPNPQSLTPQFPVL